MRAFILAGGFATRLWPLTEKRAKPLLPLAGKPIITHLIEKIPQNIAITVSTNAAFAEGFRPEEELDRDVDVVVEHTKSDDEKLGALGAVAQWIEEQGINEDILLLTGDNYCGFSMDNFLSFYEEGVPLLAAFDVGSMELAKQFGTVIVGDDGKEVVGFEEKPLRPKSTLASTGCSIIPQSSLTTLTTFAKEHPDNVGGIFEELLRQEMSVHCFQFSEAWFDIGSFQAYLDATKLLVGDRVLEGNNASIEKSHCRESVVVGDRCKVKESSLSNTVLFNDCEIVDCVLSDCVLDKGCKLRGIDLHGKMLREGTHLTQEKHDV